MAATDMER